MDLEDDAMACSNRAALLRRTRISTLHRDYMEIVQGPLLKGYQAVSWRESSQWLISVTLGNGVYNFREDWVGLKNFA